MKTNAPVSLAERRYLENEEFNKANVEEVKQVKNKAATFRKANGYSLTFFKLMNKWSCSTPDEWRALRKKHKKENYIGPKREKKPVETPVVTNTKWDKKKNSFGNNRK